MHYHYFLLKLMYCVRVHLHYIKHDLIDVSDCFSVSNSFAHLSPEDIRAGERGAEH